nr:hypothetical protein [Streptomyces benahoarensis]
MRIPVRHVAGNVIWPRHGTCWALWRVEGSGHAQSSRTVKERRLRTLESLVKQLRGEAMLLSLCPQVDPAEVVRRMTDGVDLAACERYAQLATRVWDQLERLELTSRADWLAVPLPAGSKKQAAGMAIDAARAEMAQQLGLLPAPVGAREEVRRLRQAQELAATWPATVALRPATESEILWIYGHSARRGVLEPLLSSRPSGHTTQETEQERPPTCARGQRKGSSRALIEAHHRRARARRPQTLEATDPLDTPERRPARHLPGHRRPRLRPQHHRLTNPPAQDRASPTQSRTNSLGRAENQRVASRPAAR